MPWEAIALLGAHSACLFPILPHNSIPQWDSATTNPVTSSEEPAVVKNLFPMQSLTCHRFCPVPILPPSAPLSEQTDSVWPNRRSPNGFHLRRLYAPVHTPMANRFFPTSNHAVRCGSPPKRFVCMQRGQPHLCKICKNVNYVLGTEVCFPSIGGVCLQGKRKLEKQKRDQQTTLGWLSWRICNRFFGLGALPIWMSPPSARGKKGKLILTFIFACVALRTVERNNDIFVCKWCFICVCW